MTDTNRKYLPLPPGEDAPQEISLPNPAARWIQATGLAIFVILVALIRTSWAWSSSIHWMATSPVPWIPAIVIFVLYAWGAKGRTYCATTRWIAAGRSPKRQSWIFYDDVREVKVVRIKAQHRITLTGVGDGVGHHFAADISDLMENPKILDLVVDGINRARKEHEVKLVDKAEEFLDYGECRS